MKESQKINPDAAPVFKNNLETTKPVTFDPEAEPNRKDNDSSNSKEDTVKYKQQLKQSEKKYNPKPQRKWTATIQDQLQEI